MENYKSSQSAPSGARSAARNQHYVPRCLLSAFGLKGKGKKLQVRVYDKHTDRTFATSIENIFSERDFNTFEGLDGTTLCLEDGMASIEDQASPVLRKIIQQRSLADLNDEERSALLVFAALQKVRGVGLRAQLKSMVKQMRSMLEASGDDPDTVPQLQISNEGDDKLVALELVRKNLREFAAHFADKKLLLLSASKGRSYLLGDLGVVWANHRDTSPYGNLGLAVLGIEIYLPISPDLTLAFWCPSLVKLMEDAQAATERAIKQMSLVMVVGNPAEAAMARENVAAFLQRSKRQQTDLACIVAGTPLQQSDENVIYANGLQVAQAERYVVSATGDFDLVKQMIADNPEHRRGHRFQIG